jgi:hypothetical protein
VPRRAEIGKREPLCLLGMHLSLTPLCEEFAVSVFERHPINLDRRDAHRDFIGVRGDTPDNLPI